MTPKELHAHKIAPKQLEQIPTFKQIKKGSLPAPFHRLKSSKRVHSTGMLDVAENYVAIFIWRDGPTLTDRAFFGYLFVKVAIGRLHPVFEFHWHPSHKGFHCRVPCRTEQNYVNRMLPGAPELAMKTDLELDPGNAMDRNQLISVFCSACGIGLPVSDGNSLSLFQ